ncbi:MAG: hypothetical protein AB3N16_12855 [Flavobacteriaceae bacterium]
MGSAIDINEVIKNDISKKKISGKVSNTGGFDVYSSLMTFFETSDSFFVKLNVAAVNIDSSGLKSKLTLKRVDSFIYKIHFFFSLFFILTTIFIAFYILISTKGEEKVLEYFLLPFFGVFYLILIVSIGSSSVKSLKAKIENSLSKENIKLEKIE